MDLEVLDSGSILVEPNAAISAFGRKYEIDSNFIESAPHAKDHLGYLWAADSGLITAQELLFDAYDAELMEWIKIRHLAQTMPDNTAPIVTQTALYDATVQQFKMNIKDQSDTLNEFRVKKTSYGSDKKEQI